MSVNQKTNKLFFFFYVRPRQKSLLTFNIYENRNSKEEGTRRLAVMDIFLCVLHHNMRCVFGHSLITTSSLLGVRAEPP